MTDMTCTSTANTTAQHPLLELAKRLSERARLRKERKHLKHLSELDDHMLRDIGLSRRDIIRTIETPPSVDATAELYRIAHLNRSKPM